MNYQISNNRAAHVVIDTAAITHNLERVRQLAPACKVMAVIKADGYGHSMSAVAKALTSADEFAVTGLDDVKRLRGEGITKSITILSSRFDVSELNGMNANAVRPVIYDHEQLALVMQIDESAALDIWLKIDTGMGRLGFSVDDAHLITSRLMQQPGIRSVSAMTHLANSDKPEHSSNQGQIDAFIEFADAYPFHELSIMNSAGTIAFSEQARDFVRPGLMLYGISPQSGRSSVSLGLRPAMTFRSELISVKRLPTGSPVGYGSSYTCDADTRIGVVACGYADGYPRHAPNGSLVLINDLLVPIIGRVSMDLITVDLGEMPVVVGDAVTLWGADNPIENLAEAAGTIPYELLCGITQRVERLII